MGTFIKKANIYIKKTNIYISIVLLYIVAGGSLPYMFYPRFFLISFFIFSFVVRRINQVKFQWDSSYNYLLWLLLLMAITSIYNDSFDQEFKRIIFVGFTSYVLLGAFTFSQFKHVFLNVVTVFSIVSLVIFFTSLIISLPLEYNYGENVTTGYYMYHAIAWNNHLLLRNASIFNEPGCFQYFLNYTLLLHIEDAIHLKLEKNAVKKLCIVIVALLTSASTTGYIVLMFIIVYVFVKIQIKNKLLSIFIILPIILLAFWNLYNSETIKGKLDSDSENASFVVRTADVFAMIQMINDHPWVGNGGIGTKAYIKRVQGYGALTPGPAASNGILVGIASMGLIWLIIFSIYTVKAIKKNYDIVPPWALFALLLLIHSNEYYIFFPVTYIFLASFHYKNNINPPKLHLKE